MPTFDTSHIPQNDIEQMIQDCVRTHTNSIAGRPNAGNLVLTFAQNSRMLPAELVADYLLLSLQRFIPNVRFSVMVEGKNAPGGFHDAVIGYEVL